MNTGELHFRSLIAKIGEDFSLSQGLGGNCSYKSESTLYVKASGRRMAESADAEFFYALTRTTSGFLDNLAGQSGKPSIEAPFHALLKQKYVLHLHSLRSLAVSLIGSVNSKVFGHLEDLGIRVIPYKKPGVQLMKAIEEIEENGSSGMYLLCNHGVLVGSDNLDDLSSLVDQCEAAFQSLLTVNTDWLDPRDFETRISQATAETSAWHAQNNWPIAPDHVVFLGAEADQDFAQRLAESRTVGDLHSLTSSGSSTDRARFEQMLAFVNVMGSLPRIKFRTLSDDECAELIDWDAEKHRVGMASGDRL